MKREEGIYWVQSSAGEWYISLWKGGQWFLPMWTAKIGDVEPSLVHEARVCEPMSQDEPIICVHCGLNEDQMRGAPKGFVCCNGFCEGLGL